MIGICTDSGAQLPPEIARRLGIAVVPLTITVDGVDHLEGVDLDADGFWARFEHGTPAVSTAAPSPGRFLQAWDELASAGATSIVSVHTGSKISGTLNAAAVAARQAPIPVHLVDTGSASFVVGCAAWAAADRARAGDEPGRVAEAATQVALSCRNVFVVGTLAWARAGGRFAGDTTETPEGVPVLALDAGQIHTIGTAAGAEEAAERMAREVLTSPAIRLRVGVGDSDPSSGPVADALAASISAAGRDVEVVRYRVGPSVGAHTGPGTAGAVFHPL